MKLNNFDHSLFDELIGHSDQISQLKLLQDKNSVPHALLFSGPAGVGKRTLGRAFAASLLAGRDANADFLRQTVGLVRAGTHPDFHIVTREEGKRDLSVDIVRELTARLQFKPYYGRATVTLIDNAHQMNPAAANALLKTLEEPNSQSYLILITDSPHRLLETVLSRCQQLHFGELEPTQCLGLIASLLKKIEGISVDAKVLHELAKTSLAPLALDSFVDPRTLTLVSSKALLEHLHSLAAQSKLLSSAFESLANDSAIASALSLAAELGSEKDSLPLVWCAMRSFLQQRLRSCPLAAKTRWADLLWKCIESEKLCHERNLNPQLQLGSVLTGLLKI